MPSAAFVIVVLGTGGTIAGVADSAHAPMRYRSGALAVADLIGALPEARGVAIESEEVARIDSKDMSFAVWRVLAARVAHHVARTDVGAVVITHGTDTMEETAYFLDRHLAPAKPVILTGAMRPSTASDADGPRNLADAVGLAASLTEPGVVVAFAGQVHASRDVRKVHPHRLDAFTSGDAGPLATLAAMRLHRLRPWPAPLPASRGALPVDDADWPRVAIVTSTAAADAGSVTALVAAGFDGIVVAATGNGTVHAAMESALRAARAQGIAVLVATRCLDGSIVDSSADADALPVAADLMPAQARVELILRVLAKRPPRTRAP